MSGKREAEDVDESVKVAKLTQRTVINHKYQPAEHDPLILTDHHDRAVKLKLRRKRLVISFLAIASCLIVGIIGGVIIYLYSSRVFLSTSLHTGDTEAIQGDYALIPYHAQKKNIFYKYELQFSVIAENGNKFVVDIYKVQCNRLPITYESFDSKPFIANFSSCNPMCFFDQFIYEAKSNKSIIRYDIYVKDFISLNTSAQVLAFDNLDYLLHTRSIPFKTAVMTTDRLQFTLHSAEIKESSYYSFAIKCDNCSSNLFTINRSGIHTYYNGSNLTPLHTINNTNTNCSFSIRNENDCFLGKIQGIRSDSISIEDQVYSIHHTTHSTHTKAGYIIIGIIIIVFTLVTAVGFYLYWRIRIINRRCETMQSSIVSRDSAIVVDSTPSFSLHTEIASHDNSDYSNPYDTGSTIISGCIPDQSKLFVKKEAMHSSDKNNVTTISLTSSDSTITSCDNDCNHQDNGTVSNSDDDELNSSPIAASSQTEGTEELLTVNKRDQTKLHTKNPSLITDQFARQFETDDGQLKVVQFDEKGLVFHSHMYGATVVIPKGAVQGQATLQLGVALLLSGFKCEGQYEPVSPFIWIHIDAVLSKPAKLYIPHYINSNTADKSQLVLLVRGHEKDAFFKIVKDPELELLSTVASVSLRHFCIVCLANAMEGNPPEKKYHVVCAEKSSNDGKKKEVHICVLYTLKCLESLQVYYEKKGFIMSPVKHLKGNLSPGGIMPSTDLPENGAWKMAILGNFQKITCEEIDIYQFLGCTSQTVTEKQKDDLKMYENSGSYPPRFILNFYNTDENVTCQSVTININGLESAEQFSHSTMLGEKLDARLSFSSSDTVSSCTPGSLSQSPARNSTVTYLHSPTRNDSDGFIFDVTPLLEGALVDTPNCLKFGLHLGITMDKLQDIEIMFGDNPKRCIMHILLQWKQANPEGSYKEISEALLESGYSILSAVVTRQFSATSDVKDDEPKQDEYVIIEGPTVVKAYDRPRVSSIDSLSLEIIQRAMTALPNGYKILRSEPSDIDLASLVVATLPAKWMLFGTQVNIKKGTLEGIERNNIGKCQECFNEVLYIWKRRSVPPYTWETVLRVLYSPAIKEYKAGEDVYLHLLHAHSKSVSTIIDS